MGFLLKAIHHFYLYFYRYDAPHIEELVTLLRAAMLFVRLRSTRRQRRLLL